MNSSQHQSNGWHDNRTTSEPIALPTLQTTTTITTTPRNGIVVFSGGTAANSLVDVFDGVCREANQGTLGYVIPVSDNGGSSSELIRVFGGPGMYT